VDLAVLADQRAIRPDEYRGVEAARTAVFVREFRISQVEADAELLRFVEQRLRFRRRNRRFVKLAVDLGLVWVPLAREKRREREFGKHHELCTHGVRITQQFHESLCRGCPRVHQMERAQLGRRNFQVSGTHVKSLKQL